MEVGVRFAELAEIRSYRDLDPAAVLTALDVGVAAVAERLGELDDDQWIRIGIGSEGDERTVTDLARRLAHELRHHLLDMEGIRRPS